MNEMLTPQQVAEKLAVSKRTLDNWRDKQTGPEFVRLGDGPKGSIRYPLAALEAWLAARTVRPEEKG